MLIEFAVTNCRSIRTEQVLSLVMTKSHELTNSNSFTPESSGAVPLLRSAAVYGPNAAGKSNIIDAMRTMKQIVLTSAFDRHHGDPLPLTPFRLDRETEHAPCEFEVNFVVEGCRYQYGFAATRERVTEEWLLAFPLGRPQRWIGRVWNEETQNYEWDPMRALTGNKQVWKESTRSNALFLSTAVQLNCKQLQPVYDWFKHTLRIAGIQGWNPNFTASLCKELEQRTKILDFLKAADIDIQDVLIEFEQMSTKHLPDDIPDDVKKIILDGLKEKDVFDIKTVHLNAQGEKIEFDFEDESDGTRKLFAFAGPWIDALNNGFVLIIDELHDNLHPKLVQFLIQLFHSTETNPNNAQLIFTTHETSILNQEVLRRDQIWFCEKDNTKGTCLYPLTDFSPRKGRENLEMSYLAGRYGALPFVRSLKWTSAG